MKSVLTFLAFLSFSMVVIGQHNCGTVMTEEYDEYLRTKDRSYLAEGVNRANTLWVPIQYHLIGNDQNEGFFSILDLLTTHCNLNEDFAGSGIQFYFYDLPNYIANSNYYTFSSYSVGNQVMNNYNVDDVTNVYINEDPRGVCGYAYYPGSGPNGGGMFVAKNCSEPDDNTITHEMGHYLGLPHTFSGWEGRDPDTDPANSGDERVNGSNCASSGDYFCDTPADFISDRWGCPYTGNKVDYNGDLYNTVLDETFFMSYSLDHCSSRFSQDQETEMAFVLQNSRPYLLNHSNQPSFDAPDSAMLVYPAHQTQDMDPEYVYLDWEPSNGATHYHIRVGANSTMTIGLLVDTIVTTDHIILENLGTNATYYWNVRPMTLGHVCGDYSSIHSFKTADNNYTLSFDKTDITCHGAEDGWIDIQPTGGLFPYSYNWSDGSTSNPRTFAQPGVYQVEISDLLSETSTMVFSISEPDQIFASIYPSGGNQLTAAAAGGTSPYTYSWSDGHVGSVHPGVNGSSITLTVEDAMGCTLEKTYVISGVELLPSEMSLTMQVFPNPSKGEHLTVSLEGEGSFEGTLYLTGVDGKVIAKQSVSAIGQDQIKLNTSEIANGFYLVHFESDNGRVTETVTLIGK